MVGANRRGKPVFPLLEPPARSRGAAPVTARNEWPGTSGNLGGTAESLPSHEQAGMGRSFLSVTPRDKAPPVPDEHANGGQLIMLDMKLSAAQPGGRQREHQQRNSRKTSCPWWMKCWRWTQACREAKTRCRLSAQPAQRHQQTDRRHDGQGASGRKQRQTKRASDRHGPGDGRAGGSRSVSWTRRSARGCW